MNKQKKLEKLVLRNNQLKNEISILQSIIKSYELGVKKSLIDNEMLNRVIEKYGLDEKSTIEEIVQVSNIITKEHFEVMKQIDLLMK